ncbi:30S ribosomal protein S7 [Candidatus Geothermarchaeota archaeon]|nr:MAG: 30S ribosomal protein S7 [Candidatus Geothermarchaeota archaeon]RLG63073.1 MAG: 30S ribosomal protein S7 [Candidatus Geothermarchaeota archaeon]HEW93376.1 30S ribosomal protein S7 [Thermoprotei archaeon]
MSSKSIPSLKLFGRYSFGDVEVRDISLKQYISLKPVLVPWSGGRHEHKKFGKAEVNIVERLVNKLMRPGKMGGKKAKAINIVKAAFRIIELETGKNPIQLLVYAIENAGPCEDVTTIAYGGAAYTVSVDVSPLRRIDVALKNIVEGAKNRARNNRMSIEEALAQEIILAAKNDLGSYAINKRIEIERIALASR